MLNSLFQVLASSWLLTWRASMPGYQLKFLTMPSACTFGLVARAMNFLASAGFVALAGET